MEWKLINDSFTYAHFFFKDGNIRKFYSIDWKHKKSKSRDRQIGINRLRVLIAKHAPFTECAIIYENNGSNQIIEKYEHGILIK
jgi:hypothetical protein